MFRLVHYSHNLWHVNLWNESEGPWGLTSEGRTNVMVDVHGWLLMSKILHLQIQFCIEIFEEKCVIYAGLVQIYFLSLLHRIWFTWGIIDNLEISGNKREGLFVLWTDWIILFYGLDILHILESFFTMGSWSFPCEKPKDCG